MASFLDNLIARTLVSSNDSGYTPEDAAPAEEHYDDETAAAEEPYDPYALEDDGLPSVDILRLADEVGHGRW